MKGKMTMSWMRKVVPGSNSRYITSGGVLYASSSSLTLHGIIIIIVNLLLLWESPDSIQCFLNRGPTTLFGYRNFKESGLGPWH